MTFEPGVIAIAIAILLFYARLAQIRGRKRKETRQDQISRLRSRRKGRINPPDGYYMINYQVGNYFLLALGVVLMLAGIVLKTSDLLPVTFKPYWWEIVVAGVIAFIFCVK